MRRLLYRLVIRKRILAAEKLRVLLDSAVGRAEIEKYQTERFNGIWASARTSVPFYRHWQETYGLPDRISRLSDLDSWPVLTKADLRDLEPFERIGRPMPKGRVLTGGSTGEPVRLPVEGASPSGVSQIAGRAVYGFHPGDRLFLLWGHRHLYGKGLGRLFNIAKRGLKDSLSGWKRVSAYDLSAPAMHGAYSSFVRFRPRFVYGFSSAVLAFVRHNKDRASCKRTGVEAVFCSSGPLTPEEKAEIERFFGCSVCMEYGSVECGVMAYTRPPDGGYRVFWNTHLLQVRKDSGGECRNIVTLLTERYLPLIRYDIGDYLELDEENESAGASSVLGMLDVKGRPSEMIGFACGVSFFGALVGDCVKQVPGVVSSQMAVDEKRDRLEIRVVADRSLAPDDLKLVENRFKSIVSGSGSLRLSVVQKDRLFTTAGGKTPRVVRMTEGC